MTLEEMEAESKAQPPTTTTTPVRRIGFSPDVCTREIANPTGPGHMIMVDVGGGRVEYRFLTEDGKLIPAQDSWEWEGMYD